MYKSPYGTECVWNFFNKNTILSRTVSLEKENVSSSEKQFILGVWPYLRHYKNWVLGPILNRQQIQFLGR